MQENHIKVAKTARYFQLGEVGSAIKQVWFVCHGYGQLAGYFLKHFESLDDGERLIIAPEGFSRFYLNGFYGRIGASWMTREDRLNDIKDYVIFLDAVYQQIFDQVDRSSVKVSVLGFSQGTATASRWLALGDIEAEQLILWAGLLPSEIIEENKAEVFREIKLVLVTGENDKYASEEKILEQETHLRKNSIPYKLIKFPGGHELYSPVLKEITES